MDERGRSAAVEVDRALGPEVDHDPGELEHRQPGVDVGAPPVAGHGDQRVARTARSAARGWRSWVMSESNWSAAALKPS